MTESLTHEQITSLVERTRAEFAIEAAAAREAQIEPCLSEGAALLVGSETKWG